MEDSAQAAEIERLKARITALEEQLAARDRTEETLRAEAAGLRAMITNLPVGFYAADQLGRPLASSKESERLFGAAETARSDQSYEAALAEYGYFESDKTTPIAPENVPLARALRGEVVRAAELFVRNPSFPEGVWLEVHAAPFSTEDGSVQGASALFFDCRMRKYLEEETTTQNASLMEAEADKLEIISRLRTAVEQLSTPILELWEDVLALPVIGIVDSRRSAEMMERLLHEIVKNQARFVIIDLTGVEVIDTSTADHFMKLVKAVGLIGARCVLTGIRPAVAQTLVDLDVSFGQLETLRNLRHGLRYCLRWLDNEGV